MREDIIVVVMLMVMVVMMVNPKSRITFLLHSLIVQSSITKGMTTLSLSFFFFAFFFFFFVSGGGCVDNLLALTSAGASGFAAFVRQGSECGCKCWCKHGCVCGDI